MREIDANSAADYLRETGVAAGDAAITVHELAGGVSNIVLRVAIDDRPPIVLKQSRERLRTQAEWLSRLDRIWIEVDAMKLLATILPGGMVPQVLFEDRAEYLYAMSCAPDSCTVWKSRLLRGVVEPEIARRAGEALGSIHAKTAGQEALLDRFAPLEVFDQLRIDPYYRRVALVHSDLAEPLRTLMDETIDPPEKSLVLGDFSPKNMLVGPSGLILLDFETAHAGDPAFDLGFFLSHLFLKSFRAAPEFAPYFGLISEFLEAYQTRHATASWLISRTSRHLGACLLARIDGKSPVEYKNELNADAVRRAGRTILQEKTAEWPRLFEIAAREMRT
jgi:5-methylthioribose kinase